MMELKVADKRELADGIWLFELVDPAGAYLPAFEAGGHVPVAGGGDGEGGGIGDRGDGI